MGNALANRATVLGLVAAFQDAARAVREHFAALDAAEKQINLLFLTADSPHQIKITSEQSWRSGFEKRNADECIDYMKRSAWWRIVEKLELKRCCSIERWKRIESELDDSKTLPDITEENVRNFVAHHAAEAPQMITEAIREVFDWLRPRKRGEDFKTNAIAFDVHTKIALRHIVDRAHKWGWNPRCVCSQELTALENVFNALDGRGTQTKGYYSALELAICEAGKRGVVETDLFKLRYYQNGNGHLWIKRQDLLAKFNQIAGGLNLCPASEAV